MIPLSQAILKGNAIAPAILVVQGDTYFSFLTGGGYGSDPLGAAYLGHLHPGAVEAFFRFARNAPEVKLSAHMIRSLHTAWPHLGASVRYFPRLSEELERDRLIPRIRTNQTEYRQEIHRSLWAVICDRHAAGESKEQIAAFLGRHGL